MTAAAISPFTYARPFALPKPGFFSRVFARVRGGVRLEDIYDDAKNVIRACGLIYADETHPILNIENLVSEGLAKLAEMVRTGILEKMERANFFRYFKTSIKRHLMRLVTAQKMTAKRTGVSPLRKDATEEERAAHRAALPREVSLDAPRDGRSDLTCHSILGGVFDSLDEQMREDLRGEFDFLENAVFNELADPSYDAWVYAAADAGWDESRNDAREGQARIKIEYRHMALALGKKFTLSLFEDVAETIKTKVKIYMQTGEVFHRDHGPALRRLEEIFGLRHIPRTINETAVRRLLTITARDQHQKVTPEVARLMEAVGAKVPQLLSQTLSCFGVMYQPNHRLCGACGRRAACAVEASNVGLGEITLSPALLGAKTTRIPAIVATSTPPKSPVFADEGMEEIYHYLTENFHRVVIDGEHFFRHHSGWQPRTGITLDGNTGLIFHIQGQKLRFCKPSASLARKLKSQRSAGLVGESLSLPDDATVSEAVDLISQHARETLSDRHAEATV